MLYSLIPRPFPANVGIQQFECWPQFINILLCSLPSPAPSSSTAASPSRPHALLSPPLHSHIVQLICSPSVQENKWLPGAPASPLTGYLPRRARLEKVCRKGALSLPPLHPTPSANMESDDCCCSYFSMREGGNSGLNIGLLLSLILPSLAA